MVNLRKLLYPLSLPYRLVTSVRNWAFDQNILPSQSFEVPVISVGNLSTGGTGKTPMVEFLIRHLSYKNIGLVSRGYGRKTKGLILANADHQFDEIGDEPYQIYHKFPDIHLALSEKRPEGIQALIDSYRPNLILLDDAYQHRYVEPGFQILLTTFQRPFHKDNLLPAGNLRESKAGSKRANIIIVTKCPDNLDGAAAKNLREKLKIREGQKIFFSGLEYGKPLNHYETTLSSSAKSVIVVSGIANPTPMLHYLQSQYHIAKHLSFSDHHHFSPAEIRDIEQLVQSRNLPVITTEKDWVRLKTMLSPKILDRTFYLPLQVKILFGEEDKLLASVRNFLKD